MVTQPTPPSHDPGPVVITTPVVIVPAMLVKPWWKSKTIWVGGGNVIVFALGLILQQAGIFHFSVELAAGIGIVSGTLVFLLRMVTHTAISGTPGEASLVSKLRP